VSFFFFSSSRPPRHLHSFPTRRSSDLPAPLRFPPRGAGASAAVDLHRREEEGDLDRGRLRPVRSVDRVRVDAVGEIGPDGALFRSEEHRLNSSHVKISYAVFCLKKKTK